MNPLTLKTTVLIGLTLGTVASQAIEFNPLKTLEQNAQTIAKECSPKNLTSQKKDQCFDTAKKAYELYVDTVKPESYNFMTSGILSGYSDHVAVSIHSYTMSPEHASDSVQYLNEKNDNGIYVSLAAHRNDGLELKDIRGKEWMEETHLVTQIAQGFGDKVILTGFSLGGVLSIQEAKENPDLVSGYLAMAPSFHGGEQLPMSGQSCLARVGLVRGIVGGIAKVNLNDDFILGGCAIFRVSRKVTSNIQNHYFAKYKTKSERFNNEKIRAMRNMKSLKMPGVIIHSQADQVVSHQVNTVVQEILTQVAGDNFKGYRYDQSGPRHFGDFVYFSKSLEFSGYDGLDFLLDKM